MLELRFPDSRSTRARRVLFTDLLSISYMVIGQGRLGDCIKTIQHALRAHERYRRLIGIYPWGMHTGYKCGVPVHGTLRDLFPLFDLAGKVEMIETDITPDRTPANFGRYVRMPMYDPFYDEDPSEYVLIRDSWKPGPYGRMCYQFYGSSNWQLQNFNIGEAKSLYCSFPHLDKVKLGIPMTISQCVDVMQSSDFFVGIDSGMTHLARAVGLPTFVNKNKVADDWFHRWHPLGSPSYTLFSSVSELHAKIRQQLPGVLSEV